MEYAVEVLLGALNAATLIIVAIIGRDNKRSKDREEKRYQRRLEYERLTMNLAQKDCTLSILTAKKIAGEHVNGDLEAAIDDTKRAQSAFDAFVQAEMARNIAKQ